jgi:hypothetical protein
MAASREFSAENRADDSPLPRSSGAGSHPSATGGCARLAGFKNAGEALEIGEIAKRLRIRAD